MLMKIRTRLTSVALVLLLSIGWLAWGLPPQRALGHGCGTQDHEVGTFPGWEMHYYQYEWTGGNSIYHRWKHFSIGGFVIVDTWCGCVTLPCDNLAGEELEHHGDDPR